MAAHTLTTETKEENCRNHIAKFLFALNFHNDDPKATIKIMRQKLREIQRKEAAAQKKPPTVRKITLKFGGSTPSVVLLRHPPTKRPHSETLVADDIIAPSHSEPLVHKRQKTVNKNNTNVNVDVDEDGGTSTMINFIRSMGGSEFELVMEKRLTSTDVNKNHGRLMIPVLKVKNPEFLTTNEKMKLGKKEDISVWMFDQHRCRSELNLTTWRMGSDCYVLKTKWNYVVDTNGLKEGMVIRVFSFRVQQQLCFAVLPVA